MSSRLTTEEVEQVARLAHLALTDEEKALFAHQLADILEYARQVSEIDTSEVPPTSHALAQQGVERPDRPRPGLARDEALSNAPEAAPGPGLFKVPRVIG
jgi:aspartyl-tRNA(Asn)/glutamyl-tRNA(Gln) amidotransferase subunit C